MERPGFESNKVGPWEYVPRCRLKVVETVIKLWRALHPPAWQIRQELVQVRRMEQEVLKWTRWSQIPLTF